MFKFILLGFTIYFAYRFLFDFLLPVVRTTRQVKKQFDAVRQQQFQQNNAQDQGHHAKPKPTPSESAKASSDDYLEFEEIH